MDAVKGLGSVKSTCRSPGAIASIKEFRDRVWVVREDKLRD